MSNRSSRPDPSQSTARLRALLTPGETQPPRGRLDRLADGVLRLFDDPARHPDYEARRDRMTGPILGRGGARPLQSSSSVSQ